MPTEMADEYFKRQRKSREQSIATDHHPSYREAWIGQHACSPGIHYLTDVDRMDDAKPVIPQHRIDGYFSNMHTTLWARAWDVGPGGNVEGAKEWLVGVLGELGIEVEG
jgi:hypothetical protein